jgi:hypothetical protein
MVLWDKRVSRRTKKNVYKRVIKSILFYGSYGWNINKKRVTHSRNALLETVGRIVKERQNPKSCYYRQNGYTGLCCGLYKRKQRMWYRQVLGTSDNRRPKQAL